MTKRPTNQRRRRRRRRKRRRRRRRRRNGGHLYRVKEAKLTLKVIYRGVGHTVQPQYDEPQVGSVWQDCRKINLKDNKME